MKLKDVSSYIRSTPTTDNLIDPLLTQYNHTEKELLTVTVKLCSTKLVQNGKYSK